MLVEPFQVENLTDQPRSPARWAFVQACPCDDCPLTRVCAEGLACEAFARFVSYGGLRWRTTSRVPTRDLFEQIYREIDPEDDETRTPEFEQRWNEMLAAPVQVGAR